MHDGIVEEYTVCLDEERIVIKTRNNNGVRHIVCFENVLTHLFNCVIKGSQILEISESSIDCFLNDNRDILAEKSDYCWPMDYQSEDELKTYLEKSGYIYIVIYSSYGLNGWVLAKSWSVKEN